MKIRKINILLAVSFAAIIAFSGCNKDDRAIPERVTVDAVPTITMPIDPTGSQSITFANQAAFSGKFSAQLYFPGAKPPDKIDIVVRKTNGTINNTNVLVFSAGITSLPATFTVTAADITTLFGVPITLNDNYDFGPNIYVGSKVYEAFPAIGAGTGSGIIGAPLFKEYARFKAQ